MNPFALPPEALVNGSGKVKWLDENLPGLLSNRNRVLIFSQFVLVLDILGEYLVNKGYKFLRMDGSTAVNDRQTLIDTFNKCVPPALRASSTCSPSPPLVLFNVFCLAATRRTTSSCSPPRPVAWASV